MSAPMRIAVAGAGLIGRRHIELIEASLDCVLAGIADPSPTAKELAQAHGVNCHADHRTLLADEKPDGLIIASPNALHLPIALDCAQAEPLAEQLRHFCAMIAGRERPLISAEDAMGTLAVVEAVSEAARTGGKISPGQIMEQAA